MKKFLIIIILNKISDNYLIVNKIQMGNKMALLTNWVIFLKFHKKAIIAIKLKKSEPWLTNMLLITLRNMEFQWTLINKFRKQKKYKTLSSRKNNKID